MEENRQYLLQFTDSLSGRQCILRIEAEDASLSLKHLLEKYLKHAPMQRLLGEGRITGESAETLADLQDLVYVTADDGRLGDMFAGIMFRQAHRTIDLDSTAFLEQAIVRGVPVLVINIAIDRLNAGYDRNWVGFHRRRWMRHEDMYSDFVVSTLEDGYGPAGAQDILQLSSKNHKTRFVRMLARRIWESDFESYSRFTGRKLAHKTGDETVRNIVEGAGGICAEKIQALKFITDHYGLSSEYLLAGVDAPERIPEGKLREMLDTFDFRFSKRFTRYWQHTALLYDIEGTSILVDATNGNIPLLFLADGDAQRLLADEDKQPLSVKMVESYEDFYYHRVAQDIPENLFFAMETWIEHMDLIQVFENELGLYLSSEFFLTPIAYRSPKEFDGQKAEYVEICRNLGLAYAVSDDWTLDSRLGERFTQQAPRASEQVIQSKEHLLERYDEWDGPGHEAGLLLIRLRGQDGANPDVGGSSA